MSSLKGMSVLITGASGFLGSVIRKELESREAHTISVVWPPLERYEQQEDTVAIDLLNPADLKKLDVLDRVDAIVHCAAILPGGLPDSELLIANQLMTYHLLIWGIKRKISYFSFASTCRVYGLQSYPCPETSPLLPPDLYAVSKTSCEYMVKVMMDAENIPFCILRISAPYGPHSKAETVVRRFLMNSAQGVPIILYGSGNRSQDFVYQQDVARGFCMALAARAVGTFNLAGGISVSVKDLAKMALSLFGRDPQSYMSFSGIDAQENYRGDFPIGAAFRSFGYRPGMDISTGLKCTAKAWGLL